MGPDPAPDDADPESPGPARPTPAGRFRWDR